jgi:hypothetical protein
MLVIMNTPNEIYRFAQVCQYSIYPLLPFHTISVNVRK